jgi:hypothetical protein
MYVRIVDIYRAPLIRISLQSLAEHNNTKVDEAAKESENSIT